MCGIAGIWFSTTTTSGLLRATARRMAEGIVHRGPDGEGIWLDPSSGVALAHRRLAILDLSPTGAQPMQSVSGRFAIVFNGEIYNFRDIRKELQALGQTFRGGSDTEVLLGAVDAWGLERALQRFDGMFAFALWDLHLRTLTLARDRFGEKPLYYGFVNGALLFASDLAAMTALPGPALAVSRKAVAMFLRYAYVPSPHSIYEGINKLPAGTYLQLKSPGQVSAATPFWSASETILKSRRLGLGVASAEEIETNLDRCISRSVLSRMVSDAPLGAFLSGGTDSSLVVSMMQAQSTSAVKTFTIGFSDPAYDESVHARAIARHLGTDHTDLVVTPADAIDVIPLLSTMYSEPFADSSQIPTYLVARLARTSVKVVLSGDGGDELFGGYNRYFWGRTIWNVLRRVPRPVRLLFQKGLSQVKPSDWDRLFASLQSLIPAEVLRQSNPGHKLQKITAILGAKALPDVYRRLVSAWEDPSSLVLGGGEEGDNTARWNVLEGASPIETMMFLDTVSYLPDDILAKVDRASMAVGLEARVPLLAPDVFEFAWAMPMDQKIGDASGKKPLKALLARYVPTSLTERPKKGFGLPVAEWLRGPLQGWADDLLSASSLASVGLLDPTKVQKVWDQHKRGERNWQDKVWCLLMLQSWSQKPATRLPLA